MTDLLNLDPDVARHLQGKSGHRFRELLDHLLNRLAEVCADFVQTLDDKALIDRVETGEKFGRVLRFDSPRFQRFRREILEIESHYDFAFSTDGGGEDMPVLWVVGHAVLDRFKPLDQRFGEMRCDLFTPVRDEVGRPAKFCKRSIRFIENPVTPIRQVKPGCLGKPQQQVGHPLVGEDAGVEDDREIGVHAGGRSSVKSGFLRLAGQLVESRAAVPVAVLLEGDQVFQSNPAVGTDFVELKVSGLKELDQMWARDSEDIGGSLGGQFLGFRNERDDLALLERRGHPDEQFVNRTRKFGPIAVFIDQRRRLGFAAEQVQQMTNRFCVPRRKLRRVEPGREAGAGNSCHGFNRNKRNNRTKRNDNFCGFTVDVPTPSSNNTSYKVHLAVKTPHP